MGVLPPNPLFALKNREGREPCQRVPATVFPIGCVSEATFRKPRLPSKPSNMGLLGKLGLPTVSMI